MYVRRILRSERVSQEILLIARGESKLIIQGPYQDPELLVASAKVPKFSVPGWHLIGKSRDILRRSQDRRLGGA